MKQKNCLFSKITITHRGAKVDQFCEEYALNRVQLLLQSKDAHLFKNM